MEQSLKKAAFCMLGMGLLAASLIGCEAPAAADTASTPPAIEPPAADTEQSFSKERKGTKGETAQKSGKGRREAGEPESDPSDGTASRQKKKPSSEGKSKKRSGTSSSPTEAPAEQPDASGTDEGTV